MKNGKQADGKKNKDEKKDDKEDNQKKTKNM